MRYETVFICALMLLPSGEAVVPLNPGQSHNCTDNETVSCGLGATQTVPEQGVCSIDEEMSPGDSYRKNSGVCDINIDCEECTCDEDTQIEQRNYVFDMSLDKEEGLDVGLTLEVRDFMGTVVGSKQFEFGPDDIIYSK